MQRKEKSNKKIIKNEPDYYKIDVKSNSDFNICADNEDRDFLLNTLGDYALSSGEVEILAYSITNNCCSILINQSRKSGARKLINDIIIRYNKYFFTKYKIGDFFTEKSSSVEIVGRDDLLKTSVKMHKTAKDCVEDMNSSIRAYFYDDTPDWLNKNHIEKNYAHVGEYFDMLNADYSQV